MRQHLHHPTPRPPRLSTSKNNGYERDCLRRREDPGDEIDVTPVAPVATSTKLPYTAAYICVVCRRI